MPYCLFFRTSLNTIKIVRQHLIKEMKINLSCILVFKAVFF